MCVCCRPPSPPPERAYRAHITNQPRAPLATGALRANSGSLLTDILNAAGFGGGGGGGGGNAGLPSALVPLSSQSSQGVGGHHLDIHIAILSPPTSRYSLTLKHVLFSYLNRRLFAGRLLVAPPLTVPLLLPQVLPTRSLQVLLPDPLYRRLLATSPPRCKRKHSHWLCERNNSTTEPPL